MSFNVFTLSIIRQFKLPFFCYLSTSRGSWWHGLHDNVCFKFLVNKDNEIDEEYTFRFAGYLHFRSLENSYLLCYKTVTIHIIDVYSKSGI